jgi:hypothetical protein
MSVEVLFTLLIPLGIVSAAAWLAIALITSSRQRRKRRGVEQGVAD